MFRQHPRLVSERLQVRILARSSTILAGFCRVPLSVQENVGKLTRLRFPSKSPHFILHQSSYHPTEYDLWVVLSYRQCRTITHKTHTSKS